MKLLRLSKYFGILLAFVVLVSCEKNKDSGKYQGEYLFDYELISSLTKDEVYSKLAISTIPYPELASLVTKDNQAVDVYKISYKTSLNSKAILASGLVCLPNSEGNYPILSFQNGTNTCHSNAPTVNPTSTFFSLLSALAGKGYIISIPDYIGFGDSEKYLHPYHHKESSNASIVDMLKAVKELAANVTEATNTSDLYLMGYSQGGWATLSVAKELETNPISNLNIKGVACGAGAYNLTDISDYIFNLTEYNTPSYLPYFIESRRRNGILNEDLSTFFNEPYATNIPGLFDGTTCNEEVNLELSNTISELLKEDFITNYNTDSKYQSLRDELRNNSINAWSSKLKIRLYHSKGDTSVPSFLSQDMYDNLIAAGTPEANISLEFVESLGHNDAIMPWGVDAFIWINTLTGN